LGRFVLPDAWLNLQQKTVILLTHFVKTALENHLDASNPTVCQLSCTGDGSQEGWDRRSKLAKMLSSAHATWMNRLISKFAGFFAVVILRRTKPGSV